MFQKILSLLFILVLLVSADVVKQEYAFKAPVVMDQIAYLEGGRSAQYAFGPRVAVFPAKVLLPLGQQAKAVNIEYGNLIEVQGAVYLKPYIPAFQRKDQKTIIRQDASRQVNAIYQKDELFPGTQRIRTRQKPVTQFLCGAPISVNVITPVQYNPAREKLYYYDKITVTIETENISPERDVAAYVGTPFSKSRIAQIVNNKEAVNALPITPKAADDYEYLIISRPDLMSNWGDLVDLNTRRGMRTEIHDIVDIQSNGTGTDLADKARNWIKTEYEDHKIQFAVLGGDAASGNDNMPYRLLYAKFYDHNLTPDRLHEETPAADMYYGTLDGNWNDNNDGKFGEPGEEDMFWEVFVSRMCVDDANELSRSLNKTVKYSEQPVKGEVLNYLGLGEYLWTNAGIDVWGAMSIDHYIGEITANGHTTYGIASNFDVQRLDDRTGGGDNSWGASDLSTKFNQNRSAWVDHDGHGNQSIAYGISSTQIASTFQNDGTSANYFVGMTGACSPGKFHTTSDCFMEMLTTTANAAVAAIGNNEYGFGDDDGDNSPTGLPYRYIHDAVFNPAKRVHFFEAMHAMGKEAVVDIVVDPDALSTAPWYGIIRYCCYTTDLFGEPALSVWTDTPEDLTQPFDFTANGTSFTMNTPPYTQVALADVARGDIFSAQLTGYTAASDNSFDPSDSTCLINDQAWKDYAAANSKVKVYIKAHNYIANSFDVDISTGIENTPANVLSQYSVKPVNGYLLISFTKSVSENVNLSVYDSKGALAMIGKVKAGNRFAKLDTRDLSNGIYFCKIKAKSAQNVESFIITK